MLALLGFFLGLVLVAISIPIKMIQLNTSLRNKRTKLALKKEKIKKNVNIKDRLNKQSRGSSKNLENKSKNKLKSATKLGDNKDIDKLKANRGNKKKQKKIEKKLNLKMKMRDLVILQLKALANFLSTIGRTLIISGIASALVFMIVIVAFAGACSVAIVLTEGNKTGYTSGSPQGGGSDNGGGGYDTPVSADVQQIIDMSDSDVWKLISEGRFSSYSEANEAAKADKTSEEAFWTNLLVSVEVPCWKWADSSKTSKVDSTTSIKVNKYVADYFKAFMTDIYNQPEQYVITMVGGFSFRTKNNKDHSGNYSGHSFGATLDINWESNGMGSYSAGYGDAGLPWKTSSGLADPMKSECCTFDNSWHEVAKKYKLDWGGNWSKAYCDPMHFSLVGDNNKDTRGFSNKYEGRTP